MSMFSASLPINTNAHGTATDEGLSQQYTPVVVTVGGNGTGFQNFSGVTDILRALQAPSASSGGIDAGPAGSGGGVLSSGNMTALAVIVIGGLAVWWLTKKHKS